MRSLSLCSLEKRDESESRKVRKYFEEKGDEAIWRRARVCEHCLICGNADRVPIPTCSARKAKEREEKWEPIKCAADVLTIAVEVMKSGKQHHIAELVVLGWHESNRRDN